MSIERARARKDTASASYRLEPMRFEDLPAVLHIEHSSFSNPWPKEAFVEEIRKNTFSYPTVACLRISSERVVCGYCVPWIVFVELHIQNVAVHPLHRARGLGRFLVEEALELGKRNGCRVAVLEVRESNAIARRLYVSMGFRETGTRRKYYSRPQEHAIVYQKSLNDLG